jgi:hypothetical protein
MDEGLSIAKLRAAVKGRVFAPEDAGYDCRSAQVGHYFLAIYLTINTPATAAAINPALISIHDQGGLKEICGRRVTLSGLTVLRGRYSLPVSCA